MLHVRFTYGGMDLPAPSKGPSLTSPARTAVATAELDPTTAKRNGVVIHLLIVAAFVMILNETIMGIALPQLMSDLSISAVAAQWLTTGFMLTMAVVIPLTGFILQRFTTRSVFIAALSLFTAGTLIAAVAPGFAVLLVGRVVQASGTAIILPLLMTTVMQLEPPATRGRRMGNISIVISVAPAIGPTISGLILSALHWRFLYVFVLPVAVSVLILGIKRMQNVTEPRNDKADLLSVPLSALGFGGLVLGLSLLGESANGIAAQTVVPLIVGLVALGLFITRQLRLQRWDRALLDLRTFLTRNYALSVAMFVVTSMAMFGMFIMMPLYMQNVMELSVLQSGLLLMPGGVLSGLLAPLVGRMYDRVGPRPLTIPGSMLLVGGLLALAYLAKPGTAWWQLLAVHMLTSAGISLIFTPLFSASLAALPRRQYSHGSATLSTLQQMAAGAGTALFIAVMAAVSTARVDSGLSQIAADASGIRTSYLVGAAIAVLAIVLAFFVIKPKEGDVAEGDAPPPMH